MKVEKYQPYPGISMPDRKWPDQRITKAPVWCSVDLRDGNQALNIPMSVSEKIRMFDLLVKIGFKEIEVGFPSASETEFRFVRTLIDQNHIPEDVTIQVLTQARDHLIEKTFESLKGVNKAIIHLYNSTSTLQREVVFQKSKEEIKTIATHGAALMKKLKASSGNQGIRFQYSPESFTGTEMDYALEVCHAVLDVWDNEDTVIFNLPATVEMASPNVYADQIEWFCNHIRSKQKVLISVHTHNDRGTAVAAAELAVMAGAERVEGTLFGNGERTGNTDLVTMALNLYSQGINPCLNFSNINQIRDIYTECTRMTVHERHPYAGDLVYTAFSGSHQDAISKGMKYRKEKKDIVWEIPYLPIDPEDLGRSYESIIRINSQSGKGGIAYVMEQEFGYVLPKDMQREFGSVVQKLTDQRGDEVSPSDIWHCFESEYLKNEKPFRLKQCKIQMNSEETVIQAGLEKDQKLVSFEAKGNGPIDAFVQGLSQSVGIEITVDSYHEHAMTHGADSKAVAYIGIKGKKSFPLYGVGVDTNISMASIKAVVSALNRMLH